MFQVQLFIWHLMPTWTGLGSSLGLQSFMINSCIRSDIQNSKSNIAYSISRRELQESCMHKFDLYSKVLYMSFDRFLLAVESRDLSQADKSIIRVSSFSILQNFNFWMIKFTVIQKKLFGTWQFDFIIQKFARLKSSQFSEKEVLLPITQLWERRHSYDTFVSLR